MALRSTTGFWKDLNTFQLHLELHTDRRLVAQKATSFDNEGIKGLRIVIRNVFEAGMLCRSRNGTSAKMNTDTELGN